MSTSDKDQVIEQIVNYVIDYKVKSDEALRTAKGTLLDALGCGILALGFKECTKLMGPIVPGTVVPNGSRVPGTKHELDPIRAAFNVGCMIRWLDYNDTWLAAEWGHPSDNLGAILAVADYISRQPDRSAPLTMEDVLMYLVKAHEIQGVLALENSFNRQGLDHVILVKVASTAVVTHMMGGTKEQIFNAVSNAWLDGGVLRTYRHFPNTGSRKSWAAGDACARAVQHAWNALQGEMGYPTALSAPVWGFYDVQMGGKPFSISREYGTYVMENVLFKVSFPAEFHAQTAVEAAVRLHGSVADRLSQVERIRIRTHQSAIRIIDKKGPLTNPADRDHCLQYMTAVGLVYGNLTAEHYENDGDAANNPQIDELREKMEVVEEERFSRDYLDPEKRSIANAVQVFFTDGSATDEIVIEYPLGHRRRRDEAWPKIQEKFNRNISSHFDSKIVNKVMAATWKNDDFGTMNVNEFVNLFL